MDFDHYKNLKSSHQDRSNEESKKILSLVELSFKAAQAWAHAAKYIFLIAIPSMSMKISLDAKNGILPIHFQKRSAFQNESW